MKKIIVFLVACLSVGMLRANYWTPVDEGQYAYSMTLYGVIQIDGVEQHSDQLEVGVFCGDECRGSAFANEFFLTHRYLAEVNVYGENGHQLTFKLYDHRTNQELAPTSTEAIAFTLDGYGNPIEPYVLNFTPIVPSTTFHFITAGNWSQASNWSGGALPSANDAVSIDANCTLNGNVTVASLAITTGKTLTLPSGKTLTVTNTLTNTAITGLVIEDGAQLLHASDNVSATVKKSIAGHGTNAGKYYLISNPLTSVVDPEMSSVYHLITGNYDLYSWLPSSPDNLEWRNIKDNSFLMPPEACGYLYANQTGIELDFSGTIKPSHNRYAKSVSYDSNDTEHPGWNLIGNPFVCNAQLVDANNEPLPYYRMNAAGNGFEAVAPGTPIAPMEGVFYMASGNEVVYFVRPQAPTGAINGKFTINSNGDQVYFSQGNLQYIGSAATPYWKFADNQWDVLGTTTGQNSGDQNVDRDLFGWGTSGYNHGANCYQPWSTSTSNSYYLVYGSDTYNLYDQTGQADWGYNPISNGGNQSNQWRTLTRSEWNYVFYTRTTTSRIRYAKAQVAGVNGIILLPDDWNTSTYSLSNTNTSGASFSSNTISASQWTTLQNAGAVFLPAAGGRYGTSVDNAGVVGNGSYWSASRSGTRDANHLHFFGTDLYTDYTYRSDGLSVRLVAPAEN